MRCMALALKRHGQLIKNKRYRPLLCLGERAI